MPIKPTKNNDGNRRRERGDQTRVNERIRAPRVRVVTANGDQLGIMNTRDALEKAKALGLDLVEVASNADPPVCRVVDYGRYKYQQSKLQKNNKSRTIKLKEVKLRIGTDTNDYNVKMARTESFLDHGHKVRFQLRFRGRENAHHELGYDMLNKVIADMKTMAQVDQPPRLGLPDGAQHLPADLLDQALQILLALLELRPRFIIADAAAPLSPFPAGKNMAP